MTEIRKVYFDNAATTPVDEDVLAAMLPYFHDNFANSQSQHGFARTPSSAVNRARKQVADAINAQPNEIYFTGSGSEANTWAIKGVALAREHKGKHVLISAIEHPSVMNSAVWLRAHGFEAESVAVHENGKIDIADLKRKLRPDTVLVSCMLANNEIGTIEPIQEVAEIAHANGSLMHADCVQAIGAIKVDVKAFGVDLATISAHKFYGPKGVGALYIRNGLRLDKLIAGGSQERTMRGGTTNTPAIVGMGEAIEKAVKELDDHAKHCASLRDRLIERIENEIDAVKLNGDRIDRLPNNVNFSFKYIEGESLLMSLDLDGIAVSSGSACSSASLDPSHVLLAIGVPIEIAHGSLRFSIGKYNTIEDVDYTVESLKKAVDRLRKMSPLFT